MKRTGFSPSRSLGDSQAILRNRPYNPGQEFEREKAMAETATMAEDVRVLVVDDEENITDLLATALRYEGFNVAVAHSGREALRTVGSFRPHLIVLDVMLPDWDGFEGTKRLSHQRDRTPLLFLTAREAPADSVRR